MSPDGAWARTARAVSPCALSVLVALALVRVSAAALASNEELLASSFPATPLVPYDKSLLVAPDADASMTYAEGSVSAQETWSLLSLSERPASFPATRLIVNGTAARRRASRRQQFVSRLLRMNVTGVARECPQAECPSNARCPLPNGVCCGGSRVCCPQGSSCLQTPAIPVCVVDNLETQCAVAECRYGYVCPFASVGECCVGGQTCCPEGYRCTLSGGDPRRHHCALIESAAELAAQMAHERAAVESRVRKEQATKSALVGRHREEQSKMEAQERKMLHEEMAVKKKLHSVRGAEATEKVAQVALQEARQKGQQLEAAKNEQGEKRYAADTKARQQQEKNEREQRSSEAKESKIKSEKEEQAKSAAEKEKTLRIERQKEEAAKTDEDNAKRIKAEEEKRAAERRKEEESKKAAAERKKREAEEEERLKKQQQAEEVRHKAQEKALEAKGKEESAKADELRLKNKAKADEEARRLEAKRQADEMDRKEKAAEAQAKKSLEEKLKRSRIASLKIELQGSIKQEIIDTSFAEQLSVWGDNNATAFTSAPPDLKDTIYIRAPGKVGVSSVCTRTGGGAQFTVGVKAELFMCCLNDLGRQDNRPFEQPDQPWDELEGRFKLVGRKDVDCRFFSKVVDAGTLIQSCCVSEGTSGIFVKAASEKRVQQEQAAKQELVRRKQREYMAKEDKQKLRELVLLRDYDAVLDRDSFPPSSVRVGARCVLQGIVRAGPRTQGKFAELDPHCAPPHTLDFNVYGHRVLPVRVRLHESGVLDWVGGHRSTVYEERWFSLSGLVFPIHEAQMTALTPESGWREVESLHSQGVDAITVDRALYGGNCWGNSNPAGDMNAQCSGRSRCDYVVNHNRIGDPAVGCGKDFRAWFHCQKSGHRGEVFAPPEASGRTVTLSCPQPPPVKTRALAAPGFSVADNYCVLTGALESNGPLGDHRLIVRLPEQCRPKDGALVFNAPAIKAPDDEWTITHSVRIMKDGRVLWYAGDEQARIIMLSGIGFYTAMPDDSNGGPLPLANGFKPHGEPYRVPAWRYESGLITLSGLVSTPGGQNVLATLPEQLRPRKRLVFGTNNYYHWQQIEVLPDGLVKWTDNSAGNGFYRTWISLDGISYWT